MNRRQPRNRTGCAVGFVSRLGALSSSSWLRNQVGLGRRVHHFVSPMLSLTIRQGLCVLFTVALSQCCEGRSNHLRHGCLSPSKIKKPAQDRRWRNRSCDGPADFTHIFGRSDDLMSGANEPRPPLFRSHDVRSLGKGDLIPKRRNVRVRPFSGVGITGHRPTIVLYEHLNFPEPGGPS
jgi:hypothetical protein